MIQTNLWGLSKYWEKTMMGLRNNAAAHENRYHGFSETAKDGILILKADAILFAI